MFFPGDGQAAVVSMGGIGGLNGRNSGANGVSFLAGEGKFCRKYGMESVAHVYSFESQQDGNPGVQEQGLG